MTRLCLCGNHQHAHPSTCMLLSVAQCCPVLPSIAQCCSVLPAWKQRGWEGKGAMEVGRAEHTTWKTPFLLDWANLERTQFGKSRQVWTAFFMFASVCVCSFLCVSVCLCAQEVSADFHIWLGPQELRKGDIWEQNSLAGKALFLIPAFLSTFDTDPDKTLQT